VRVAQGTGSLSKCKPGSYIIRSLHLDNIRIIDSCSKLYSSVSGKSGFVYDSSKDRPILYTCRMLTYEFFCIEVRWINLRVGKRFLVFFEIASG
jgi:hypothetical protein